MLTTLQEGTIQRGMYYEESSSREKRSIVKYKVVLRQSDEGYSVSCPGLPGCWSQGKTENDALESIRMAIEEYLQAIDASLTGGEVREIEVPV